MRAEQVTDVVTVHGEGPVYSPRWLGVRWVDMIAGDILELEPDGTVDRAHISSVAAVFRPRTKSGMVIAIERGLAITDSDDLQASVHRLPELWTDPNLRMNEGGCDPLGDFYSGSTTYDHKPGAAALLRFDASLIVHSALDSVTVSNGIEWTSDASRAYYVDSTTLRIDVFDWNEKEHLHNRREFARFQGVGEPDGLTVDSEGGVWVALWGGAAVHRYSPEGTLTETIDIPARQVSAVTFGGPNLDQLYITTSRKGLGDEAEPAAGALFMAHPGVTGQSVREFAG